MNNKTNRYRKLALSECRDVLAEGLKCFYFSREARRLRRSLKDAHFLTLKTFFLDENLSAQSPHIVLREQLPTYWQFRYVKDQMLKFDLDSSKRILRMRNSPKD
jgi:hypothetical protein